MNTSTKWQLNIKMGRKKKRKKQPFTNCGIERSIKYLPPLLVSYVNGIKGLTKIAYQRDGKSQDPTLKGTLLVDII
jgi:hypothetical protein